MRRAAQAGIGRSVLFAAFTSNYRNANAEVGRIVASRPDRFFGYAMVNAARDAGRVRLLVREAVEGWGACGIKVHRHDARISREVCEVALSFSLPVLYDVMGEAWVIELLATQYVSLPLIVPHLGSFADDWRAQRVVIDAIARHPNVYADTSGVRRFDLLVEAVKRAGPHKILFGTDGPWLHPAIELAKVRALGLSRSDEQLILAGNWLRLTAAARGGPGPGSRAPLVRSWPAPSARPEMSRWIGHPDAWAAASDDPWAGEQFPGANGMGSFRPMGR
jgi:predicted TIM-barrel fold metal-dependent hydrolase